MVKVKGKEEKKMEEMKRVSQQVCNHYLKRLLNLFSFLQVVGEDQDEKK